MRNRNKVIWLLALIAFLGIFIAGRAGAQEQTKESRSELVRQNYESKSDFVLPQNPSLADYEKAMLLSNPAIRSAYGTWKAEIRRIALHAGLPDPTINFGYFIQNVETAVGPQEYKISIMQMIPWLGKLIVQANIQTREAEASYQSLQGLIDRKLLELRYAYLDAYYLERAIHVTRQNLELVKNWEAVITSKYKTGMVLHSNLVKTQIEAIKLRDDLETLEAKREPLLASFKALLDRIDLVYIHVPDTLDYAPVTDEKEDILSSILEMNPGLNRLQALEEAAAKVVTRKKLNYLPDFAVGMDKVFTGDRWNASGELLPESGKDPLVVMGSISIPLWFYKQSAGVGAAKHQLRKAEAELTDKGNTLRAELEGIWFELNDAARKVELYKNNLIPKSLESLHSSEKAYIGDEIDFLNLIDAQRRYLQFMLAYERATVNHHKVRARLEALAGRTI